jgi:hypothetical protein
VYHRAGNIWWTVRNVAAVSAYQKSHGMKEAMMFIMVKKHRLWQKLGRGCFVVCMIITALVGVLFGITVVTLICG